MDKEFKTTFIPKNNLSTAREKEIIPQKANSLIVLLAGLLFVTAIVSVIGVYLYKLNVTRVVRSQTESINRAEKAFEPAVILELKKLDIRLRAATELLDNHIALSDFFASLGESTLPEVSFNDFSFAYNAEAPEISMVGEAKGFIPIAQQSDLFEKNQYIQNPIFSDFQLADSNIVSFNLTFTLNSELLYYGRTIKNNQNNSFVEDNEVVIQNQDEDTLPAGKSVEFGNITNN